MLLVTEDFYFEQIGKYLELTIFKIENCLFVFENSILVDEVIKGKLQFRGSLEYLTGISHAGQKLLVGDLDG